MRTPAGIDCPYFYGDYRRGRKVEECRLIGNNPVGPRWTPDLCKTCPVPGILRANSCPNMELKPTVQRSLFGLVKRVRISAYCHQAKQVVTEPHVGCGQCHQLPDIFTEKNQ